MRVANAERAELATEGFASFLEVTLVPHHPQPKRCSGQTFLEEGGHYRGGGYQGRVCRSAEESGVGEGGQHGAMSAVIRYCKSVASQSALAPT